MGRKKFETDQQYNSNKNIPTPLFDFIDREVNMQPIAKQYFTIPSIAAQERIVKQVTFPNMGHIDKSFVGFRFLSEETNDSTLGPYYTQLCSGGGSGSIGFGSGVSALDGIERSCVLVYTDYQKSIRRPGADEYNTGSILVNLNSAVTYFGTYSSLSNVLVGYYNSAGVIRGALYTGNNRKVVCESMWFTKSDNDLILNIALTNQETNVGSGSISNGVSAYLILT